MKSRWLIRGAVAAVVLAVVVVVVLVGGEQELGTPDGDPDVAEIVTAEELTSLASEAGFPVYWAGEIPGTEMELVVYEDVSAWITYLDAGTEPGPESVATSLSVSTYAMEDPAAAVDAIGERTGAIVRTSEAGREVVTNRASRNSVYFAGSEGEVQVEVYDPQPRRAMALALSERVRPVE